MINFRPVISIFFLILQIISMNALSAGFQINEISPALQGDAMAGAAAAKNDVTSMFINPATLSTLGENQIYAGGSGIFPHIHMSNANAIHTVNVPGNFPPSSVSASVLGQNYENNISPSAFIPDAWFSKRVNDKMVVGLGIVAPYGLKTEYAQDSVVRFAALESEVKTFNINPALSYALNEKWALGIGVQVQYMQATFSNFNGVYTGEDWSDQWDATNYPTHLNGHGLGAGANLGLLFNPDEQTRLGLGYRSRIRTRLSGSGQQYTYSGPILPAPSLTSPYNANTHVTAKVTTPDILTFSAAYDISAWTLKTTAQINFWSSFDQITISMPQAFATQSTIPFNWKNTWFAAIGAEYRATPAWTLRGGLAFDETPTTLEFRDPRIPDANRIWTNIGASYKFNQHFSIDGSYSHIFMHDQTVNVAQASGVSRTSTLPLEINQVSARYTGSADVLAIGLRYSA
jgi:long-chain fatty acid transport protein